jgi:alkyl sulfatase BDS1-like metallo-beta-lactamase superfamily hydrolase
VADADGNIVGNNDAYDFLHGLAGPEIAEAIQLPPALENAWNARGYYGSVNHNAKAVYQRYLGWFDGNPSSLWQHTPVEKAKRSVEFMGGAHAVVAKARESLGAGDFRWMAEVVNHVVFAQPDHAAARELLADTYEQLGYGAECGTWRTWYLSGCHRAARRPVWHARCGFSSWSTGSARNATWSTGVSFPGLAVSAQSGYGSSRKMTYKFASSGRICGNNSSGPLQSSQVSARA